MLHTNCVATMPDRSHAANALPQRAGADVTCRIFPGVGDEAVRSELEEIGADPAVKVTTLEIRGPSSPPPPLTKAIHRGCVHGAGSRHTSNQANCISIVTIAETAVPLRPEKMRAQSGTETMTAMCVM